MSLMLGCAAVALSATPAFAQSTSGIEKAEEVVRSGDELDEIIVSGRRSQTLAVPVDVIGQTIGTRKLDGTNIVNPEDALKYVPNLVVRKRFIGDTDGAISIRGTNMSQPARTSVFIDGIPLSNFLGNDSDYSPRRRLIASDEIQSIDVMYGPYSARYSGAIRARMSEGSRSFQRRAWQSPLPASRWMRPDGTWGRRWEGWKIAREPE